MEDIDLSDHKVTSEVHVFSEGKSLKDEENIGKFFKLIGRSDSFKPIELMYYNL